MPRIVLLIPLLLAIIYAPLAYGCTTPASKWWLDVLLVMAVAAWVYRKVELKRPVSGRLLPVVLVSLLGLVAVGQVLNPHAIFDPQTWDLRKIPGGLPVLPWTTDRATSMELLPHLLVLGFALVATTDLAQSREFRWMILRAVAISGVLVALIGMVQKAAGDDPLLWGHLHPSQKTYFATFRYHGHAAAFLNLCWPAALALFLRSVLEEKHLGRNVWGLAWLFIFGALFVNTSKFGHAAALPLLLVAALVNLRHFPGEWFRLSWRNALVALVVVAVVGALALPTLHMTVSNWQMHLEKGITMHLRQATYEVCLAMVRDAPLFGFGTGSFGILFPYYAVPFGDVIQGRWSHAHQDYLQTIIEWGWIGMALWSCLFAPPVIAQFFRSFTSRADLTGAAAVTGLIATLTHALVDFPWQIASIQLYGLLYLAFLWRSRRHRHGHDPESG